MELRYLVRPGWDGPEKVLQYRIKSLVTDYSKTTHTGDWIMDEVWGPWQDVPTVDETQRKHND
jgi:hypothetical protein